MATYWRKISKLSAYCPIVKKSYSIGS